MINIDRVWAMPNRWTFLIPPIKEIIEEYVGDGIGWIDPFCGRSTYSEFRNDLDPEMPCDSHILAVDFIESISGPLNGCLFDPPYSGRQVKECYSHLNRKVHRDDTNSYFHADVKRRVAPKIKVGGIVISCGWNTNGFGAKYGFEIERIRLVPHGSSHNDTIVVVEKKI